jgi:hypothetical protein
MLIKSIISPISKANCSFERNVENRGANICTKSVLTKKFSNSRRLVILLTIFLFSLNSESVYSQLLDLKTTVNQSDYLIISSQEFNDNLTPLIALRESQNLNVMFVDIEAIYDEFQDTLSQKEAIRHFVSYTLEYWTDPKPQYVILVGNTEIIPSYRVQSRFINTIYDEDSVSVDDHYAINMYQDDFIPDIAIGRLPVSTTDELKVIVDKILNFENQIQRMDYSKDYLGIADYREGELFFESECDHFINEIIPSDYQYKRIYRRAESIYYGIKEDIIDNLNDGIIFMNYHGHANSYIMGDTSFFCIDDLNQLEVNHLPFLFISGTASQSFDSIDSLSIAHKLLLMKDRGTVASFAPTGLVYSTVNFSLISKVYKTLFSNPEISIGKIINMAKRDMSGQITDKPDDLLLRYFLLGDPAMHLPEDVVSSIKNPVFDTPEEFELISVYPNPFNSSTTIRLLLKDRGIVKINIYNIKGQLVDNFPPKYYSHGIHKIQWNPLNIASGTYYIQAVVNENTYLKKALLIK